MPSTTLANFQQPGCSLRAPSWRPRGSCALHGELSVGGGVSRGGALEPPPWELHTHTPASCPPWDHSELCVLCHFPESPGSSPKAHCGYWLPTHFEGHLPVLCHFPSRLLAVSTPPNKPFALEPLPQSPLVGERASGQPALSSAPGLQPALTSIVVTGTSLPLEFPRVSRGREARRVVRQLERHTCFP